MLQKLPINMYKDLNTFGSIMPGREYTAQSVVGYRFGFNGKEMDDETYGDGNEWDFGSRILDPRLGKWLSLDPLQMKYPWISAYSFTINNPIFFIDLEGRDILPTISNYSIVPIPEKPSNLSHLGVTTLLFNDIDNQPLYWNAKWNSKTNEYDVFVPVNQQFCAAFNNPGENGLTLEQENPKLLGSTEDHENAHVEQYITYAKNFEFKTSVNGNSYSGRIDKVLGKIKSDYETQRSSEWEGKVNEQTNQIKQELSGNGKRIEKKREKALQKWIDQEKPNFDIETTNGLNQVISSKMTEFRYQIGTDMQDLTGTYKTLYPNPESDAIDKAFDKAMSEGDKGKAAYQVSRNRKDSGVSKRNPTYQGKQLKN